MPGRGVGFCGPWKSTPRGAELGGGRSILPLLLLSLIARRPASSQGPDQFSSPLIALARRHPSWLSCSTIHSLIPAWGMPLVKILRHPCLWQLDRVRSILSVHHGVGGSFSRTKTHFQPRLTSSSSASTKQNNLPFW